MVGESVNFSFGRKYFFLSLRAPQWGSAAVTATQATAQPHKPHKPHSPPYYLSNPTSPPSTPPPHLYHLLRNTSPPPQKYPPPPPNGEPQEILFRSLLLLRLKNLLQDLRPLLPREMHKNRPRTLSTPGHPLLVPALLPLHHRGPHRLQWQDQALRPLL